MAIEIDRNGCLGRDGDANQTTGSGKEEQWRQVVGAAMRRNQENNENAKLRFFVVEKNDSLWKIAKDNNVSWRDMVEYNDFANDDLIQVGDVVVVRDPPAPKDAATADREGVDVFAESLIDRGTRANLEKVRDASGSNKKWEGIQTDIEAYLNADGLNDDKFYAFLSNPRFHGNPANIRNIVIEKFLDLQKDAERQKAFDVLLRQNWTPEVRAAILKTGKDKYGFKPSKP